VTVAFIGVGSNLDEPIAQVRAALQELDRLPGSRVLKRSSLYRSAPVGYATQPDFVNAVAQLETTLEAQQLLAELQQIEARHGRKRSFANAPRTLDLDLLLYGDSIQSSDTLTLPHPRMHERAFVLEPLMEIAEGTRIPGKGPAKDLLRACAGQRVETI
jgi:2-amino-4-hydroxy-6-hydroxymethyldihydropteridine diphosphokinase